MTSIYPAPILSSLLDGQRGTLSEDAVRAKMERRLTVVSGRDDAPASGIVHKSSQAVTNSNPQPISSPEADTAGSEPPPSDPATIQLTDTYSIRPYTAHVVNTIALSRYDMSAFPVSLARLSIQGAING